MNLYLDTSAIVKQYIQEAGSDDVRRWVAGADLIATSAITLAEMNAAFARGVRMNILTEATGERVVQVLKSQWPGYIRIPASDKCIYRAAEIAWRFGFRGYDAIHVALAEIWQELLSIPVTFVAYDKQLLQAVKNLGMNVLPEQE